MQILSALDQTALIWLNAWFEGHPNLSVMVDVVANNNFVRGLPVFFALSFLWFKNKKGDHIKLSLALSATCLATVCSVLIQHIQPEFGIRPFLDGRFNLHVPTSIDLESWKNSANSWPSDTATLFAGLCASVYLCHRFFGICVWAWTFVVILIPRIAFGYHYLSDVLSGIILGVAFVLIFSRASYSYFMIACDEWAQKHTALVSTLFVLFMSEMNNLFFGVRSVLSVIVKLMKSST